MRNLPILHHAIDTSPGRRPAVALRLNDLQPGREVAPVLRLLQRERRHRRNRFAAPRRQPRVPKPLPPMDVLTFFPNFWVMFGKL